MLFGPHGFLRWPQNIKGHHLPSDSFQVTLLNDAPKKLPGRKKAVSFEEGKGQQHHGTVVEEARTR